MDTEPRYQKLYNITKTLNTLAPDAVLPSLVEGITKAVNVKGCSLMFFTPDKRQLIHTVSYGLSSDFLEKGPIRTDTIIDELLRGNPVLILDIENDPRCIYKKQVKKEGVSSILSIPLIPQGETVGIVRVYTAEPRVFSQDDIDFLRCLADIGAIYLQKARVHESLEASLEERCRDLAKLEQEKNNFLRFLGIAAHDLKAPLSAIQSYFKVMLGGFSGELNDKQRYMIERSSVRITELLSLISDLLDIPRIETGQLVQEMKECSLLEIINHCLSQERDQALQKGLSLKAELPEAIPQVYGSASRLQQVVANLLNNAIKYTPEGEVFIRATEGDKDVQVDVIDTGIGIPSKDLPHMFSDFFCASNIPTKGTGLGLSIVKRIVEAHGGKIWCESPCKETNNGSRFTFVLPKLDETKRREF